MQQLYFAQNLGNSPQITEADTEITWGTRVASHWKPLYRVLIGTVVMWKGVGEIWERNAFSYAYKNVDTLRPILIPSR